MKKGYILNLLIVLSSILTIMMSGNFGPAEPDYDTFCFIHLNLTPAYDYADLQMTVFFYVPFMLCVFFNFYLMF